MHGLVSSLALASLCLLSCSASMDTTTGQKRSTSPICLLQSKFETSDQKFVPTMLEKQMGQADGMLELRSRLEASHVGFFIGGIVVGVFVSAAVFMTQCFGGKLADVVTPAFTSEHVCESSPPPVPRAATVPPPVPHAATVPSLLIDRSHSTTEAMESMDLFWPRCSILGLLMLFQSSVSAILIGFQQLLQEHPEFLMFLTMVVGTGGNVGGQSVVNAVRKMALGKEVNVLAEVHVALKLAGVLAPLCFARTFLQVGKLPVSIAIAMSVAAVCVLAAWLGVGLPKVLKSLRVDPAHATPIIQVSMDILGALVVCLVGHLLLRVIFVRCPSSDGRAIFFCD